MNKKIKIENINSPKVEEVKKKRGFFHAVGSLIHGIWTFLKESFLIIILLVMILTYLACTYLLAIVYDVPEIDPYTIQEGLTENSIIVDQNGRLLETLYGDAGIRKNIAYDDIGQDMIDAIVAIEDKTFFDHKGFNYIRLVGAVVESYESGNDIKGTSTITQQLAKNIYLSNERAIERKVKEAYYAILLERTLTKEQILEAYLNKINLGMQTNGVASAAQMYFSKDAKDLDLIESAIIAGIPKAPSRFSPLKRIRKEDVGPDHIVIDESDQVYTLIFNPIAQDRYTAVINQMYYNEMITEQEYDFASSKDISQYLKPTVDKTNEITSYFGDMVKDDAIKAIAESENISLEAAADLIYNRGYIIYSTIDFEMQQVLESVYNDVVIDNLYDDNLYAAVKNFQRQYDLVVDGVLGRETLGLLNELVPMTLTKETYSRFQEHDDILIIKEAFNHLGFLTNEALFPQVVAMFDENKNIINDETRKVLMCKFDNVINENNQLMIKKDDYYFDAYDNLILLKDGNLEFYQQDDRVQVVVKNLFTYDEHSEIPKYIDKKHFTAISGLYIYEGRDVLIDDNYKEKVDGNLVIHKDFLKENPDFFSIDDQGTLLVDERDFIINWRGEIQPQSAFVVLDHHTGEIKAVVGGRKSYGENIYNRALVPHQPGSSIKPIGTYTVAIESRKWTAASVIDDLPAYLNKDDPGKRWPINWYEESSYKYRGRKNLRQGVEDSLNVVTAKLANQVGVKNIVDQLKAIGVTTIQEEDGSDVNLAAMALGGMTYGISPIEMTAAYATYANEGVYIKPISFTKITDLNGRVIIDNTPQPKRVLEEQVAFIIQDMMRTAVSRGYARKAQIRPGNEGIPIAGKTGTTSDKRDALFIGYSPYYTAAIWFGNDIRLKMDQGSGAAAEFWQLVMERIHVDFEDKNFVEPEGLVRASVDRVSGKRPSSLSSRDPAGSQVYSEIFLPGTVPKAIDDSHVEVLICLDSNKLATAYCENSEMQVRRTRLEAYNYSIPVADQVYMVPGLCDIPEHQSETIQISTKVIQTFASGEVKFIKDYSLLLLNGEMVFIPIGSLVSTTNYDITRPDGSIISGGTYNLEYITKPQTQAEELLRRIEE
ncbi:hypothetical protein EZV73_03365 [Acidaminobacter sp. JC074]|uniref:transglycosylase domain-containing protein n=1 Tax=Acidaminobacter sp. JC074 TaxID=2530199 RepID=UPI001F104F87|nr:transglycosylase domain-containing protein [Acidaminobacter sp. JC074]MCH4886589.1 hypothetical protein [Acidaminobacter sp. JC074]